MDLCMDQTSNPLSSGRPTNRCVCLFECECERVQQLISEWTSAEVLKTVQNRLFSCTDPTEIFARFACVLFYREILNGAGAKLTGENLIKARVALRFVYTFVNEENVDCSAFFLMCWNKFRMLCTRLEDVLSRISHRSLLPLVWFVEEVLTSNLNESNLRVQSAAEGARRDPVVESAPIVVSASPVQFDSAPMARQKLPPKQNIRTLPENIVDRTPSRSIAPAASSTERTKNEVDLDEEKPKPQLLRSPNTIPRANPVKQTVVSQAVALNKPPEPIVKKEEENEVQNTPQQSSSSNLDASSTRDNVDRSGWFKCPKRKCPQKFKYDWLLRKHLEAQIHRRAQTNVCDECGWVLGDPRLLHLHVKAHDKNNRFHCDECDFCYSGRHQLSCHKKYSHRKNASKTSEARPCRSSK